VIECLAIHRDAAEIGPLDVRFHDWRPSFCHLESRMSFYHIGESRESRDGTGLRQWEQLSIRCRQEENQATPTYSNDTPLSYSSLHPLPNPLRINRSTAADIELRGSEFQDFGNTGP
jgi:hypothetical protein